MVAGFTYRPRWKALLMEPENPRTSLPTKEVTKTTPEQGVHIGSPMDWGAARSHCRRAGGVGDATFVARKYGLSQVPRSKGQNTHGSHSKWTVCPGKAIRDLDVLDSSWHLFSSFNPFCSAQWSCQPHTWSSLSGPLKTSWL
jgi:hypothetical protein